MTDVLPTVKTTCDYVYDWGDGDYSYCDVLTVYTLNGVHYCAMHEPFPPGDYPARG